jgi:UDP-glucose 4-epimerase
LSALAEMLLGVMDSPLRPQHAEARRINPVPRRVASTDAAWRELGFRADVRLEDGLRDLVAWWRRERSAAKIAVQ